METIQEAQQDIIDEFSFFDDWQDKYAHIIELGRTLDTFPADAQCEENLVRGCQSQVWLTSSFEEGVMHYQAASDALIVSGLIALLLRIFSNRKPQDILDTDTAFLSEIGLDRHLSMSRANGLASMIQTIKKHAGDALN